MADAEQVVLLRQGVNVWNAWRKENDSTPVNLGDADLTRADLAGADLSRADLAGVRLTSVQLDETNLANANLTGCHIYGISAWNLKLEGATQTNLVITPPRGKYGSSLGQMYYCGWSAQLVMRVRILTCFSAEQHHLQLRNQE